ncbi:DNA/RNA-binding domain of Phe-tRNA-synthetase-like protein [Marmoricola sp. URHA0025 HA25]
MPELDLRAVLERASIDRAVFALRPDYRALLVAVDGLDAAAPGDSTSDVLLEQAEAAARNALRQGPVEEIGHVAAWRDAYRAFGAKPQRTRNSLEALLRRAESGLSRVNRLTDIYNAVSILHKVPLGGEDLAAYEGPPHLIRATGREPFDTMGDGVEIVEHPEPGEVVWCDDAGVTCRRWNWRQGRRTRLSDATTAALFIIDALAPLTDEQLLAAAADLVSHLRSIAPDLRSAQRLFCAPPDVDDRD